MRGRDVTGLIGSTAWIVLLTAGIMAVIRGAGPWRLRVIVTALLIEQLFLHTVYGDEPFLYAAHFVPLLILLTAFASKTRFRWPALALVAAIIGTAGIHNFSLFQQATTMIPPR